MSETESIDEVDKLIATYKELVDKFNEKEDDEVIVTNFGAYYETVKKQSMSTYHDTRSHVIGVVIEELDEVDEIPTYDELHELGGEIIETTDEGCVQLWRLNGKEYVVMPDNSVISREEDNSFGEVAYFPY